MEYALITGGTSGIGKEVSKYLLDKDIYVITTGSREHYKTGENEIYLKNDQKYDFKISEKIKEITNTLKYIFLNVGIFVPDDASEKELEIMNKVNYISTINILHDLNENNLLEGTRIIVNTSIQAKYPREFTKIYADTKKKLSEDSITYAKEKNIMLSVIGPSGVHNTPMMKKRMEYSISKGVYSSEKEFINTFKMTNISDVICIIDKLFFGNEKYYKKDFMHKFIPIIRE